MNSLDRAARDALPATRSELRARGHDPRALRRLRRAGLALPTRIHRGHAPVWYSRRHLVRRMHQGAVVVCFRRLDGLERTYRFTLHPDTAPPPRPRQPPRGPITAFVPGLGWRRFFVERARWARPEGRR